MNARFLWLDSVGAQYVLGSVYINRGSLIIERCERHDQACLGLTEGAMIGTEL